jgi:hypothetical protein
MTTITMATYSDGTLAEQITDDTDPPAHLYFDTDGVTLLSSVAAAQWEIDLLRRSVPPPSGNPLSGSGAPTDDIGVDSDTYIDRDSNFTYGPKVNGAWPVGVDVALPRA